MKILLCVFIMVCVEICECVCVMLLQAYEKQKKALRSEGQLESGSEEREKIEKFKNKESSIVSKPINPFITGTGG